MFCLLLKNNEDYEEQCLGILRPGHSHIRLFMREAFVSQIQACDFKRLSLRLITVKRVISRQHVSIQLNFKVEKNVQNSKVDLDMVARMTCADVTSLFSPLQKGSYGKQTDTRVICFIVYIYMLVIRIIHLELKGSSSQNKAKLFSWV